MINHKRSKNTSSINIRLFYALCFIILFVIEVLIALYVRDQIIRPYVGDILVVVLVYCFARIFIGKPLRLLPLWVFLFACGVEVMQYFQVATLLNLQHNTVARIVIGSTFDWKDIMCYAIGCLPLFFIRK